MTDQLDQLSTALAVRYTVERELGRGGMATVYLAEDLKHHRKVAIKVLRRELAAALGGERFLEEIRVTANLHHPHIVQLYDSGEAGGVLYYVMPVVEGESLRDKLDRESQLAIEEAVTITRAVAEALDYAHRRAVIHRDIKPENILLQEGAPLVSDFGIALAVSRVAGERLTETGLSLGTPSYMSPEQATGDRTVDARSDIYALGSVLYEMLAGDPPFLGSNVQAVIAKVVGEKPVGLRAIRDTVPAHVEAAVARALAKVPADRFATAQEFADALSGQGAAVSLPSRSASRRRAWLGAIGVMVAVAAAGAYLLLGPARDGGRPTLLRASYAQLTAAPRVEWFPSLSPDGQWIVYSGEGSGNRDIYLKSVGGQNAINVTPDSPADDDQPAFSPDGERIAFRSSRDGGGIFVMGRTGDAVRRVTRTGFKPAWSPDGTQLTFVTENVELNPQNSEGLSQLWVVGVNGGEPRQLDVVDAITPSWSPGGQRIAYTRRLGEPAQADLWTTPAAGGEETAVTSDAATDWNPTWSPDGRYLYFASDRGGSMNLWRVAIDEASGETQGDPEPITTPATSLAHITVSADGRRIAYSSVLVTSNIQKATLDPSTGAVIGQPTWVTTGSRRWSAPDPSPDGRRLVFYSLVQPEGHLFVADADGTGLRELTGDSAIDRVPRWSPDGEWIAVFSNRSGPLQLWKVRPDGSDLQQLTEGEYGGVPVWSPDGLRMAGITTQGDDRHVYVFDPNRPWTEQTPQRLPPADGPLALFAVNSWSPDGERLAGQLGFADTGIIIYTFRSGVYERLTDSGEWPVWLPDGRHVMFVSGGDAFFVVDRRSKEVRTVFSVTGDVIGPPRLSRDGREVYFTRRVTEADIWLLTLP